MAPAFVSSIEIVTESTKSDGAAPENTLYEDVQFRYGTIRWENTSSGSTGGTSKGSWDLGEKKPLP
jgi:type VI protein secretion system component Hcp